MSRTACALTVLAILVLSAPPASASDLAAVRASGNGGVASGDDAVILVHPERFTLDVAVGLGNATLIDEVSEAVIRAPSSDVGLYNLGSTRHDELPLQADQSFLYARDVNGDDPVMVVAPLGASTLFAQLSTDGPFLVEPVAGHVIESSHVVSSDRAGLEPSKFRYYEYVAPEGLAWRSEQSTTLEITGDFELYFWGIPFTLTGPQGTSAYQTGYSVEPTPGQPAAVTTDDHYRYARITVRGGTLHLAADSADVTMFAQGISAQPEEVTFVGADGTMPGEGGRFTADGKVTATQGAYTFAYKPGGMDVDVTRAPLTTSGPYVRFTPTPWHDASWVMPLMAASMVLVGLAATAYTYPTVRGLHQLRYMESLTGNPRERGWRKSRAEGYALLAAAAEDAGHLRRAILWMALASRLDPHDPMKRLDLGIFHAARGNLRRALRHFSRAHVGLLEAGDTDEMAHNAYEAARTATLVGEPDTAIDWLRIAIQADSSLAERAGLDPGFAALRDLDDYASLTRA